MIAPFLEKGEWTDSDVCWSCEKERDSREHFFKECNAWTKEIWELWVKVGEASGKRKEGRRGALKSRKGFGFRVRQDRAMPSNTTIRDLPSDDRYTEAV